MPQATQQQAPVATAPLKQGSRWLYAQPDEPAVKEWFDGQHLHTGMEHAPYYGGIVLIGAKEKFNTNFTAANGATMVREQERVVFTPYVKVDTRIAYFWTLVETLNIRASVGPEDEDLYYGVIEPVEVPVVKDPASPYYNGHLPKGYFITAARGPGENAAVSRYICAQWEVAIYKRQSYLRYLDGKRAPAILRGVGTKQTLLAKQYPDDNAIMKAETGAIGRALGVAGILVVGTGIATAEDIQEAQASGSMPTVNREGREVQAQLPGIVGNGDEAVPGQRIEGPDVEGAAVPAEKTPQDEDTERRERATALSIQMKEEYPEAWEAYLHWYRDERKFPSITELTGAALKGALVKLERAIDEARNAPEKTADAPATPVE